MLEITLKNQVDVQHIHFLNKKFGLLYVLPSTILATTRR